MWYVAATAAVIALSGFTIAQSASMGLFSATTSRPVVESAVPVARTGAILTVPAVSMQPRSAKSASSAAVPSFPQAAPAVASVSAALLVVGAVFAAVSRWRQQETKAPVYFDEVRPLNAAHWATAAAAGTLDPEVAEAPAAEGTQRIRMKLKSYYVPLIEEASQQILQACKQSEVRATGPVRLPNKRRLFCVLTSPHVNKDAREHFEIITHSRLIDVMNPTPQVIDSLMALDIAAGVDVEVKLM